MPLGALASTAWLAEHFDDPDVVVLDATWHLPPLQKDAREEYRAAHIPGALYFDIDAVSAPGDLPHMLPSNRDFAAAVGAMANRDEHGNWLPTYEMARSFCLLAAAASEVAAFDTVFTDFKDGEGLRRYASNARRDGFSGMLAIHPAQVDLINAAFVPTSEEIEQAGRIVELFESNPGMGTMGMDGKMLDRPHYVQALRLLELARLSKP